MDNCTGLMLNPVRFLAGNYCQLRKNSNFLYDNIGLECSDPTITRVFWVGLSNGEVYNFIKGRFLTVIEASK